MAAMLAIRLPGKFNVPRFVSPANGEMSVSKLLLRLSEFRPYKPLRTEMFVSPMPSSSRFLRLVSAASEFRVEAAKGLFASDKLESDCTGCSGVIFAIEFPETAREVRLEAY